MTDNHKLLFRLAELMLLDEQQILPVDLLFDDEEIGDFVKSIQIDSPYQQMLLEGVLTESARDEKLYISFTVEGYFHYVLGEVIYTKSEEKSAEYLKEIIEHNKLNGAKEGVEQCLIRDVKKDDLSRLMWLIDRCESYLSIYTLPLAAAFLKFGNNPDGSQLINFKVLIKKIIKLLNTTRTNNDIEILENVIDFLELKSKNIICKVVCDILLNEIQINDSISAILILKALDYKEHKFKIQYSKKILKLNPKEINKESAYFYFYRATFLSDIYDCNLALFDLDQSLSIFRLLKGDYEDDIGACYNDIALLKSKIGDFKGAINDLEKKSNINTDYIYYNNVGTINIQMGNLNAAVDNFDKCLQIKLKLFGPFHDQVQLTYNNLGVTYDDMGDFEMAEYYFNQSLNISYKIYGEHHDSIATSLHNLAGIKLNQDNIDEAIEYYKKALKIRISIFGENHEKTANTYRDFSAVFSGTDKYKKTYSLLKKSLKINEIIFGKNAFQNIDCLNGIGIYYWNLGDFKRSLSFFETTKNICKKHYGERHPKIETAINNLAVLYEKTSDNITALKYYRKSISLCKDIFGDNHPKLATSFNNIGLYYKNRRRYQLAEKYYNKSLTIRTKVFGDRHTNTAVTYNNLGVLFSNQNKYELAIIHHLKALDIRENIFGEFHDETCSSLNNLATCYFGSGNSNMASEMITRAYFGLSKLHGNNHPKVLGCAGNCSVILQKAKKYKDAIRFLEIELKSQGKENKTNRTKIQNLNFEIANCYMEIGEFESAIKKLKILNKLKPTITYLEKLALCYKNVNDIKTTLEYQIRSIELMKNDKTYNKKQFGEYLNECIIFAKKHELLNIIPSWLIDLNNDL